MWFDNLSFDEVSNRSAALPPNSAIFYALFSVDAEGVAYSEHSVLPELHSRANAPIFGTQSPQLGKGIVGGPLNPIEDMGRKTAGVAARVLNGEVPESIKTPTQVMGPNVFDWRELRHWKIDESRLPAGSTVQFRPPTVWEQYKWYVIVGGTVLLFQAALVIGLAINLARRKRAEQLLRESERQAQEFGRRLIQAQEAERSKLARELHDDVTQRLACLAIEIQQETVPPHVSEGVLQLSEDVRSMAHQLHPSLIEHVGLAAALQTECEKFSRQTSVALETKFHSIPDQLPIEIDICLFRVAQEALRNVNRHSQARTATVRLAAEGGEIQLEITDDGVGFDLSEYPSKPGLRLTSMVERVQLLGGRLDIQSKLGSGTTIAAWIPLAQVNDAPQANTMVNS